MLSQKQLQDICLMFSGNCRQCRYLREDPMAWQWYCVKHKKSTKEKTDEKIAQFIAECKKNGIDPYSQGEALGDNCKGYPILKHIQQGYDC
jgi:hypothetical protein